MFIFGGYTYTKEALGAIVDEMLHESIVKKHFLHDTLNGKAPKNTFFFLRKRGLLPVKIDKKGGSSKAYWSIYDEPYLTEEVVRIKIRYNPAYGDDRTCECGHSYYRHFDSYENMETCGCKYCGCFEFVEAK